MDEKMKDDLIGSLTKSLLLMRKNWKEDKDLFWESEQEQIKCDKDTFKTLSMMKDKIQELQASLDQTEKMQNETNAIAINICQERNELEQLVIEYKKEIKSLKAKLSAHGIANSNKKKKRK